MEKALDKGEDKTKVLACLANLRRGLVIRGIGHSRDVLAERDAGLGFHPPWFRNVRPRANCRV